jgi:hypothetical protein
MSTVIYNAYRFKSNRASTVEKNNTLIREVLTKKLKSTLYKKMTDLFIEYKFYLMRNPEKQNDLNSVHSFLDLSSFDTPKQQSSFLKDLINQRVYSDTKFYKLFVEMTTESTRFNLNNNFNHKVTVYFRTLGEYTYYLFMSNISDVTFDFRNDFETYMPETFTTYDYWNNTDGPEDMTYAAWSGRGRKWDKVFKHKPSNEMNKIEIELENYSLMDYQNCIDSISDDYNLFKIYYDEIKSEIYFSEITEQYFKETGKRSDGKTFRETVARIRQDFADGSALELYPEFEDSPYTRDRILTSLFYDAIPKTTEIQMA